MNTNKYKGILVLSLLVVFTTGVSNGYAQQCDPSDDCNCGAGSASPAGIMVGHPHEKGNWMFSYRYMFMNMKNNQTGTREVNDETVFSQYIMSPTDMQMQMHMVMAMYGITERLSVMGMLQYQSSAMGMAMFSSSVHQHGGADGHGSDGHMDMHTSGLADSKLYVSYTLTDTKKQSLVLSGGVNIPTGSTMLRGGAASMYPNSRLPYMMQLGSGTVDFMSGITYNRIFGKWQWGVQAAGVYRPFYNTIGYQLGQEAVLTTWAAYRILPALLFSGRLEAQYQGVINGRDVTLYNGMEPAAQPNNYGGSRVNTYLGFTYRLPEGKMTGHKLAVECGLPVYQNVNGIQLSQQVIAYAAWLVAF
jgi:hypothetical protein